MTKWQGKFEIEHLDKLVEAFFEHVERKDDCEYGSIGLDCKRPFGNSDVEGDILEIIGVSKAGDDGEDDCWSSKQREYAGEIYTTLPDYMRHKFGFKSWRQKFHEKTGVRL